MYLPQEVKIDGREPGLNQGPETPEEMWSLARKKERVVRKISMWSQCQGMSLLITKQSSAKHTQKQAEALWQQGKKLT